MGYPLLKVFLLYLYSAFSFFFIKSKKGQSEIQKKHNVHLISFSTIACCVKIGLLYEAAIAVTFYTWHVNITEFW